MEDMVSEIYFRFLYLRESLAQSPHTSILLLDHLIQRIVLCRSASVCYRLRYIIADATRRLYQRSKIIIWLWYVVEYTH